MSRSATVARSAAAAPAAKRWPIRIWPLSRQRGRRRYGRRLSGGQKVILIVGLAILALGAIYYLNSATNQGGKYAFQVGEPGPEEVAPPIQLPATDGSTFDLASLRGQTVLLFFQEGLMCQPCWDQITDIEAERDEFQALGIDTIVSITTDPLDALRQKVADEQISIPVLSDPDLRVSTTYEANQYGMMGTSHDGHSFILVDEDGTITWRADYGGEPNYTMYVPVDRLIADIRKGLNEWSQ
ncbi:MAG: peroxiredoxin family protein [Thermomicrobiales bacterium]